MTALFSWLKIAYAEVGVKEYAGLADNPRVVQYHKATSLHATDDEVPWCSSFVNWCMLKSGYPRTNSARARSWEKYGVRIATPIRGCIVVFTRTGGGHVAFFDTLVDEHTVRHFGGNQADAVNFKQSPTSRVVGYYMPEHLNEADKAVYDLIKKEDTLNA